MNYKFAIPALAALAFALPMSSAQAGGKIIHDYLGCSLADNCTAYPDGVAKISLNCDTGDFVLRAHGLAAGRVFELRSGGDLDPNEFGTAVGNGLAGLGNNVLIKGNVADDTPPGAFWNIWDLGADPANTGSGGDRVLRGERTVCS